MLSLGVLSEVSKVSLSSCQIVLIPRIIHVRDISTKMEMR